MFFSGKYVSSICAVKGEDNEVDFIKKAYEFVRDSILHSAGINEDVITCTASEVLKAGHGICLINKAINWCLIYS